MAYDNELRRKALMDQFMGPDQPPDRQPDALPMEKPTEIPGFAGMLPMPGIRAGEMNPNAGPAPMVDQSSPLTQGIDGSALRPGQGATAPLTPDYKYRNKLGAIDDKKFDDPNYKSPKYQLERVEAQFDPSLGVDQPGFLDALNALKLGTFSRRGNSRDYVDLTNGVPEWDGMTGADLIGDFGGANSWGVQGTGPGWEQDAAAGGAGGHSGSDMGGEGFGGALLDSALSGDPLAKIQQAIAQLSSGGRPNFEALMAQLGQQR